MIDTEKGEHRTWQLLRKYDLEVASTCMVSAMTKLQEMEESIERASFTRIGVQGMSDRFCFRIRLRFPLTFLVSPDISRFRTLTKHFKSNVAYLPAYLFTLNIFTAIKFWNEYADDLLGPASAIYPGYLCFNLATDGQVPELSSLNFILRHDAALDKENEPQINNLVTKYFRYLFWNVMIRPNVANYLIFHDFNRINSVNQMTKSLFIIDQLGPSEEIMINDRCMKLRRAMIRQLVYRDRCFRLEPSNCYLTSEIVKLLNSGIEQSLIFSGLMNTVSIDRFRHRILASVIEPVSNSQQLAKNITGIIITTISDEAGQGHVGERSNISKEVFRTASLFKNLRIYGDMDDHTIDIFDRSISELYPLVQEEQGSIHLIHACLVSYLSSCKRNTTIMEYPGQLMDLSRIIRYRRTEARLSGEAERLKRSGIDLSHLLSAISVLKDMINYSSILRK